MAERLTVERSRQHVDFLVLDDAAFFAYFRDQVLRGASFAQKPGNLLPAWQVAANDVTRDLFLQVRNTLLTNLDDLIASMAAPFEAAGAKLTAHVVRYGFTASSDANDIIDRDADTIAAFRELPGLTWDLYP